MPTVNERVEKHRAALRKAGLRPLQLWVPNSKKTGFKAECFRQSFLVNKADQKDKSLNLFMENALTDLNGWEN